ncbi:unnamed protein product [Polarella glacialis]|uniref:Tc1-like transposase DDE domain-containing protein n=1 Tax=Polarella glacialis TaxID=89957 RepID=A0A813IDG8_POLGL|nr:unnamed protein product [Polarella glacialis]
MAPHMTPEELDCAIQMQHDGVGVVKIHERLSAKRVKKGVAATDLTSVRKALKGKTFKRGRKETRGRKRALKPTAAKKINTVRKKLIKDAKGMREVHWKDILKAARVTVISTTASRYLKEAGLEVKWQKPREKPLRQPEHEQERMEVCGRWRRYPSNYFTDTADLIMDNKLFRIPTFERARQYAKMQKVRGHLRLRSEGLEPGFTKPSSKKHMMNFGGSALVCAGLINCRVKLWHYLPKGRWNGEVGAATYRGPIYRALKHYRGEKAEYKVIEDNDPSGYKCKVAVAAKKELGIKAVQFPRYSPDLNPLDYSLWDEA